MELVVITAESILPGEAAVLNRLLGQWPGKLHLRKPGASQDGLRDVLAGIEPCYRERIVLHDHFGLVREFGLAGVHLNGRNPQPPGFPVGHISRSCHTLEEVAEALNGIGRAQKYNYVFLSPVFDSISKSGYGKAFTREELEAARLQGIINERVYALGGVDRHNIKDVARMGFGGVAVLGALWQDYLKDRDTRALVENLRGLAEMSRCSSR